MERELHERLEILKALDRAVDAACGEAVELGDHSYAEHCEELFSFLDAEVATVKELLEA